MKPKIIASVLHKTKPVAIIHFESVLRANQFMDNLQSDQNIKEEGIIKLDLVINTEFGETIIRSKTIKD